MATYLAHDALRLPAASLLANSGLCVNIEMEIWLLLGVNVATAYSIPDLTKRNISQALQLARCTFQVPLDESKFLICFRADCGDMGTPRQSRQDTFRFQLRCT